MENLEGKTAFVSGASQGNRARLCHCAGKNGGRVALAARNEAKLEAVAQEIAPAAVRPKPFLMDVSDERPFNPRPKQPLVISAKWEILVNNAGITRDNLLLRMNARIGMQ